MTVEEHKLDLDQLSDKFYVEFEVAEEAAGVETGKRLAEEAFAVLKLRIITHVYFVVNDTIALTRSRESRRSLKKSDMAKHSRLITCTTSGNKRLLCLP